MTRKASGNSSPKVGVLGLRCRQIDGTSMPSIILAPAFTKPLIIAVDTFWKKIQDYGKPV